MNKCLVFDIESKNDGEVAEPKYLNFFNILDLKNIWLMFGLPANLCILNGRTIQWKNRLY